MKGSPTGFWGKLEKDEDDRVVAWHPVEDHCADVAACFEALMHKTLIRKRLARLGGLEDLTVTQVARLCVLALWHDLGKYNQGFQAKSDPKATERDTAGHVRELLSMFPTGGEESKRLGTALDIARLDAWGESEDTAHELLIAAISHHGKPVSLDHPFRPDLWRATKARDPYAGASHLAMLAKRYFPEAFHDADDPLPKAAAFQHAFSGLVMLADWLGSDTRFFPYSEPEDGSRMPYARRFAAHALASTGIDTQPARQALGEQRVGFERVSDHLPRAAQVATLELPVSAQGGLDVLEAETGAGKTEAALARFIQLFQEGQVDGLYFALPTRTAATQIHERVRKAVERAFPDEDVRPPVVLAVPGYLNVDDQTGRKLPGFKVLWNDDKDDRWRYRGWAAEHAKRYLAGPIVVGTIDQVLLSTLAVNHAHMRASALLRHLLVIDEVHASDAYMNRLLETVLTRHLKAGGHAFLMSATLGASARERFLRAVAGRAAVPSTSLATAIATPYPLLTHWNPSEGLQPPVSVSEPGNPKRVRARIASWASNDATIAAHAMKAAREGARVLIIRNTVRECRTTQEAIERIALTPADQALLFTCASRPTPHHARYAREDRIALDEAIERRIGKGAPDGGVVIVATQTVQQSLDLDADLLLTDLCPMDVLLQRVGRLHRHAERIRPVGYESPAPLIVLTDSERDLGRLLGKDGKAHGKHGIGTVYEDLRILEATLRELERRPELAIPADCRELVEVTTHPDALASVVKSLQEPWAHHERTLAGLYGANRRIADLNLADWSATFGTKETLFPSSSELGRRIQTRLGEGDRLVTFPNPLTSPFGQRVKTLTLPAYMAGDIPEDAEPTDIVQTADGFDFTFGTKRFRYDRLGLQPASSMPHPHEEDLADA